MQLPEVETIIEESAIPQLTDRVRAVLDGLLPLLSGLARANDVRVTRLAVSGFVDPDEEFRQVVATQWLNADAESALCYWDRISDAVASWGERLPRWMAEILTECLSVEVRWKQDDATGSATL